jgi:predicted nucleic acid-binding protein
MGWLDDLATQVVGLDTAPLIYFIEANPTYLPTVKPFFTALDGGEFTAVTSVITLLEVLVHPLRQQRSNMAQQYQQILLHAKGLTTKDITVNIAKQAAQLRATYNIGTPDAIQIATALQAGANFFLTNDKDLKKVTDLTILVLGDLM